MNKKELTEKCREILYAKDINEEGKSFLSELIQKHPSAKQKIGCGIADFCIESDNYGGKCFAIERVDGSKTDFSFVECISPRSYMKKVKIACRTAISDDIQKLKTDKAKVIHHRGDSFNDIAELWLGKNKEINLAVTKTRDNCQVIEFEDINTSESFRSFHNERADLEEIGVEEHKLEHGGMSE